MRLRNCIAGAAMAVALLAASLNVSAASVADLMNVAFQPIGKCLYVYGGGWNEADDGAGTEAMTKGISDTWIEFYNANDSSYDYKKTRYQIHNGLDCTGYVGWCMYQLFGDEYSDSGYVTFSRKMTQSYTQNFGGRFTSKGFVKDYACGDIMSSSNHAYIVLGGCGDGSVVFLHASPPNVSLCGTYTPDGNRNSEAVRLATHYMSTYFPECYKRYPQCSRNTSYLTDYNQMKWDENVLPDTDGYRNMTAEQILKDIFENIKLYVNDERVAKDTGVFIAGGRTLVPMRHICEALGATVEWDADTKTVKCIFDGVTVKMTVGSNVMYKNGKRVTLDVPAQIVNDYTMVPARAVAEAFGADISWNPDTKTVNITK